MESEKTMEKLDLIELLGRFMKNLSKLWLLVLILAVLFAGLSFYRGKSSFVPYYESKAIFSVSSGYSNDDIFSNPYYYDTNAVNQLVGAFPSMLNTDIMRDLIIAQLDKNYINGTITPSQIADTNLFELTVRSTDPQDAYDILCAVIDCYPQVIGYTLDTPRMIVRQDPFVPETPINSFDPVNYLAKGAIVGLVLGFGVVVMMALLSRTVNSADGLKQLVNLPLLGSIPFVTVKKRRTGKLSFISTEDDPGLGEAVRGLRTKLHKQLGDKGGKVILLTSTLPGEGKSTLSVNLAMALAAEGHRVALVDADLRNQSIHRMFGTKPKKSLMECMKKSSLSVLECLRQVPDMELYYLSGESVDKRHYAIDSKALRRVLDTLSPEFDYVVLDSAPCSVVSDTALLARHADAVLYVVKQDFANETQILDAISGLHERAVTLTGTIINAVPRRKTGRSGYGYGYGYSYGYGSKYGYEKKKS